eukprot:2910232-Alexandrium_andersonii.AAC.1
MSASLVGSEMCIRDRCLSWIQDLCSWDGPAATPFQAPLEPVSYTHLDAADDMQCVDLGGR